MAAFCLLFGVLCLLYGILVAMIHSGTRFYMVWLSMALVLFLSAAAFYKGLWLLLPGAIRLTFLCVFILGLLAVTVTGGLIVSSFTKADEAGNVDYLLVLGAQVNANGPSRVLAYRLDAAYAYLAEHPDTLCILSGGQGYNEPCTEAAGMEKYLLDKGIASDRLLLEEASENTLENIKNSKKLIPEGARVAIVTNNFHLFRATHIAKKQGLTQVRGIGAYSEALYLPNNVFRETLGVVKDLLKGNM